MIESKITDNVGSFQQKVCLVAGVDGFLGYTLALELLKQGHRVFGIDNVLQSFVQRVCLIKDDNFAFVKWDICNLDRFHLFMGLYDSVKERHKLFHNIDVVFNLACYGAPKQYNLNKIETLKASSEGIFSIIDFAVKCNAKLVHTSTSEIYGEPQVHPQPESYFGNVDPVGPRSCYNEGKRFAEALITVQQEKNPKFNAVITRIFNSYGPNMDPRDGRVVNSFIYNALRGKDIEIYGSGDQTRSFCYQSDTIDGLIAAWQKKEKVTTPINIGNPEEITIIELAKLIKEMTGSESKIVFKDAVKQDPSKRCPEITLAKNLLNWSPKIGLKEGLALMIDGYKSQMKRS